ncbi:TIGR01777 family oxidoreductase [Myxococcota bacterium]|nr:TIGR01777 family oxidoreductase [Myxococcota bacterium]
MDAHPILVTGATGLVGRALADALDVIPLPRQDRGGDAPWWEPAAGRLHDRGRRFGAVVHLAGAGVADRRWTEAWKREVMDSRVQGSRTLVSWLRGLPPAERPGVLVSASAVGFYGDRGDEELPEDAPPGVGFLAEVCQAWEDEVRPAEALGVRVVRLRIGIVLSARGGALGRMLPAFRLGGGGPMGSGRQWFPWVHLQDVVGVIRHALATPTMAGAHNVVSPGIVRQRDFATALGRALHRPAVLPVPAAALKLAMGAELAEQALLASTRAVPRALLADPGFRFRFPDLDAALSDLVG